MSINKRYKAFTLAEVILTLTIVGSIASFTIPALIQSVQDAILRTAWRSASSIFFQASRRLTLDNSGSLKGVFTSDDVMRDKLSNYLIYTKKCNDGTALGPDGCWNASFHYLGGDEFAWWDLGTWSRIILNNGMLVAFAANSTCSIDRAARKNGCGTIAVDVNGFKSPNIVGKDIFFSYITENGSFESFGKLGDLWSTEDQYGCDLNKDSNADGFTCAAQYLRQ